jgi:hypothetical protein
MSNGKITFTTSSQNCEFFAQCLASILELHGLSSATIEVPIHDSNDFWAFEIVRMTEDQNQTNDYAP